MIRVLVADDSPTIRALLVAILEADPEIQVIGQARNGEEAVRMTEQLRPDLITMDIHMPRVDGLEATKEIMIRAPTPIIIVSSAVTESAVGASLDATRAGALLALATPSSSSPRFREDADHLRSMARAMAGVKVVRRRGDTAARWASLAEEQVPGRLGIVAIAASTGGPAALHRILLDLPRDFPVPILVVQHISRNFVEGLCAWLNSHCDLRLKIPRDGERLEPHSVYLAPDDHHLGVRGPGVALLSSAEAVGGFRPSASFLFESVARAYGASAVAVVLTGMGRDGAEGALKVRQAGGMVLAQDEATSVVYGMPAEAVRIGAVRPENIMAVEKIATALTNLAQGSRRGSPHSHR